MLKLVPQSPLSPEQAVIERIKKLPRPSGAVQCNRCGSRTVATISNGAWIDANGHYHRGTLIGDRVCYDCDKRGIFSPMLPDLKPIK